MNDITLVILCAGESSRFDLSPKKQWLRIGDNPLWLDVANKISTLDSFTNTIIVAHKDELEYMKNFNDSFLYVQGGTTRQNSIKNALKKIKTKYVLITDVARACIPKEIIQDIISKKGQCDCVVPYLNINDTVVYNDEVINRQNVKIIQTPQLSLVEKLKQALNTDIEFTDESTAIKNINGAILYVKGSPKSSKLTLKDDISLLDCLEAPSKDIFVGNGIDIHPFEENKTMFLGGIILPYSYGFKAHSDGDVLIHSIIDGLLGAIGAGDIGEFFPDNDDKYKGIDSKKLLEEILNFVRNVGYKLINIDCSILAQIPKINPHKQEIKESLSKLLNIPKNKINIKATTFEKLGFIGRKEALGVTCTVSLKYYDWKKK